jgi:MerR family redox-sensitive transcriptional activator SoxR
VAEAELSIGEVARRAGLRPSTIRYYESIGLLPEADRIAGRRRYQSEILRMLAVVGSGRRAGLTLDEIRDLLTSSSSRAGVSKRLRETARRKLPEVEALIERSILVRSWLEAAAECRCPTLDDCPLFDEARSSN